MNIEHKSRVDFVPGDTLSGAYAPYPGLTGQFRADLADFSVLGVFSTKYGHGEPSSGFSSTKSTPGSSMELFPLAKNKKYRILIKKWCLLAHNSVFDTTAFTHKGIYQ